MSKIIAEFLKQKRREVGLTQQQFALKSGVSLSFLRRIEQEQNIETIELLNRCLSMFNAKLGVVLDDGQEANER